MFKPEFQGPIEGYVVNNMRRNYFRVAATLSEDDYMQEARLVFCRLAAKYEVEDAAHFMALFKTSWSRRLNDLSTADTEARAMFAEMPTINDEDGEAVEFMGERENDGMLAIMIRQAPREINQVLALFLNAPQELLEIALKPMPGQNTNAQRSRRVAQLLGMPLDSDPLGKVEAYFSH